jgi:hypothetical protein
MMPQAREQYRKLPGRRRGLIMGSSVWLGADHLLLVKSSRFREVYRRFYFRDIQAIVTAKAPRFHISTRSVGLFAAWLLGLGFMMGVQVGLRARSIHTSITGIWWAVLGALVIAWIYVSAARSCRTRIYTAVSAEELPSLYREWTARRFLNRVAPLITQAQGAVAENWAEAVEEKQVGAVPEGRLGLATAALPAPAALPPGARPTRTQVSILLVSTLLLGGLAELLTLGARDRVARWVLVGFLMVQVGEAVAAIVENYRGRLRASICNLAIVTLAAFGVWFYASQIAASALSAYQQSAARRADPTARPAIPPTLDALDLINYPISRGIAGGISVLLGFAGVILLLRGEQAPEQDGALHV